MTLPRGAAKGKEGSGSARGMGAFLPLFQLEEAGARFSC